MTTTAAELAARLSKELKEESLIITGADIRQQVIPRIPSGLLSLDVALGGGWPLNQWHEVIGDESSGKTATVLHTIAANQALNPKWEVLWIAAEEFVPEYAAKLGCDLDRIYVVDTNIQEKAFNIVLEYIDERAVDCVVIDSLPQLIPSQEGEDSIEDWQVGLAARMNGKFFRKARKVGRRSLVIEDRPIIGFMINQWRVKVGGWAPRGQDPKTSPGGKGKDFAYFVRLEVRKDEWLDNGMTGQAKEWVGQTIKYYTIKNKSAPPHRTSTADFYFADWEEYHSGEFDRVKDVFSTALLTGVMERRGAYFLFGEEQWQGRPATHDALRKNSDLLNAVTDAVMVSLKRERGELDLEEEAV
jgi:recombination protein RecA